MFGNVSCFMPPSLRGVSAPNSCLTFYLLYFVLPPLEDNGLPLWVPGVLGLFYYPLLIPSKILLKIKDYKNIVIEGGSPKMAEE